MKNQIVIEMNKAYKKNHIQIKDFVLKVLLVITVIAFAVPLYISFINAFKTTESIIRSPFSPTHITLENIRLAIVNPYVSILGMYKNSLTITICSLCTIMAISPMGAYYIARTTPRRSSLLTLFFLLGMMIPPQIRIISLVRLYVDTHLIGTILGLIIFYSGNSLAIIILTRFIKTIPIQLEEAASIDGASNFIIFWKIIFPLLKPALASVLIFNGRMIWNDFMTPMLLLKNTMTITLGIVTAIGPYGSNWGQVFAYVLLSVLPVLILYLSMQKYFITGITGGAMKG